MLTRKDFDGIRVGLTEDLDVAIKSPDDHAKEKVLVEVARKHGLMMFAASERTILLYEKGNVYALQVDIEPRRMVVKTLRLPEPV